MIKLFLSILLVIGFNACSDDSAKDNSKTAPVAKQEQSNSIEQTENNQTQVENVDVKNRFSILSAKLSDENNIVVKFSQELSKDNEYKSLVALNDLGVSSFKADGDTLTIVPKSSSYDTHELIIYKEIKNINGDFLHADFRKSIVFQKRNHL